MGIIIRVCFVVESNALKGINKQQVSKTSYKLRNSAFSRTHLDFTKFILENGVEP